MNSDGGITTRASYRSLSGPRLGSVGSRSARGAETDYRSDQVATATSLRRHEQIGGHPVVTTPIYDELVTLFPAAGLAHPEFGMSELPELPEMWDSEDLSPDTAERDDGGTTEAIELPVFSDEPTTCYWCGIAIAETAERYGLVVTDPVGEDELMLTACSEDHAHHLRMRYRSAS